jgi:transposase
MVVQAPSSSGDLPTTGLTMTASAAQLLQNLPHTTGMDYVDPGAAYYEERYRQRVLSNLQRRAKALGYVLQQATEPGTAEVS